MKLDEAKIVHNVEKDLLMQEANLMHPVIVSQINSKVTVPLSNLD
jgi:hypothetical protein